jgi:hypothetical protein
MKIIPQIDTYPRLVSFCQTPLGKLVLLAAFAVGLIVNQVLEWPALTVVAGAISFFPRHRRLLLSVGALYWLIFHHTWLSRDFIKGIALMEGQATDWHLTAMLGLMVAGVFAGTAAFFQLVRNKPLSPVSRRPVLVLVGGFYAALILAGTLPLHGLARVLAWVFVAVLTPYLWFFGYALADASSKTPDGFTKQFGFFHPFWMAPYQSTTPIGKGAAYLRRVEAQTPKDFSGVQLKAVKLLLWIFVLDAFLKSFSVVVHGGSASFLHGLAKLENLPNLGIPTLGESLRQTAAGSRIPFHLAWGSVAANFVETVLGLYVGGNLAVACCRMAGFHALRNTYRPLQSATLAEFWNRYYYYFKELLVDFFFFPCYRRYFKKYRRLRLFAATISAATVGNMLYHFSRDFHYVADLGFRKAAAGFHVFAVYTLILGVGIGVSQLRNHRPQAKAPLARRVLASAMVILFFAILETLNHDNRVYPLSVHLAFLWNMVHFL